MTFQLPVDMPVGIYDLRLKGSKTAPSRMEFVVLFNPYNAQDDVYMADAALRTEYVERTYGGIWQGRVTKEQPYGQMVRWGFDQNTKVVLDVALSLLGKGTRPGRAKKDADGLHSGERRSPTDVSRWLSYTINKYVLSGKWADHNDEYEAPPNAFPWTWQGTGEILRKYTDDDKKQPVRWGQCWVFSGVYTAIGRALGLPTRSVTNFDSAHDRKPFDAFSDTYFHLEPDFKVLDGWTSDSVWNFHVWNDVWMRRSGDGTGSADGWQAVDATPQETSEGLYQMGPASLARVKELGGKLERHHFDDQAQCKKSQDTYVCPRKLRTATAGEHPDVSKQGQLWVLNDDVRPYDEPFVMGEVNSDKRWMRIEYTNGKPTKETHWMTEKKGVGTSMMTQRPGAGYWVGDDVITDYRSKAFEEKPSRSVIMAEYKGAPKTSASSLVEMTETSRLRGLQQRQQRQQHEVSMERTSQGMEMTTHDGRVLIFHQVPGAADEPVEFQPVLPPVGAVKLGETVVVGLKVRARKGAAAAAQQQQQQQQQHKKRVVRVTIEGFANSYHNTKQQAGKQSAKAAAKAALYLQQTVTVEAPAAGAAGADGWTKVALPVGLKSYLPMIADSTHFTFTLSAVVEGSTQVFLYPDVAVTFRLPPLRVKAWHVDKSVLGDHVVTSRVMWTNPLKMTLSQCYLFGHVSGTDVSERLAIGELGPFADLSSPFVFDVPACAHAAKASACKRVVTATLNCKELPDMHGAVEVDAGSSGGVAPPGMTTDGQQGGAAAKEAAASSSPEAASAAAAAKPI